MTTREFEGLLDAALEALLSMEPAAIEQSERSLRGAVDQAGPVNPQLGAKLRQIRAAALQSAQLWHECVPQEGYSAAGGVDLRLPANFICFTG